MITQVHRFTNDKLLEILSLSQNATAIYTGFDLIIQTANDVMIGFWGKDRSVIGKPLAQAVPELAGQPFIGLLQEVWKTGITYETKNAVAELLVGGKLQTFYFNFACRAIKNGLGQVDCILHTATDVTELNFNRQVLARAKEQKSALDRELALNEQLAAANQELEKAHQVLQGLNLDSREQLRFAVNAAQLGTFDLDPATGRFLGNRRLKNWFGLPDDAALALSDATDVIAEADRPRVLRAIEEALDYRSGGIYDIEYSIISPYHPIPRLVRAKGMVLFNGEQAVRLSGILQDVTEEKNAMKELLHAQNMLRLAIEASGIGSWQIDPSTKALKYSATLAKMFGYEGTEAMTYEQAIGQVTEEFKEMITQAIEKAIATGANYDITYSQRRFNDGEVIWLHSLGKMSQDQDGEHTIFSGVVMEITEQKQDEQRKNDFIGMVSHELKTPLSSMKGYLQMLQGNANKSGDTFTANALDKANNQVRKMTSMINGFLNVSRLESGKILVEKTSFNFIELIQQVIEETLLIQSSHQLQFLPCEDIIIEADRDKIGTVVSNLLSNAIKYSPNSKSVEISCKLIGNQVQISVKDEGIGIGPKDIGKLFDRYYRVENQQSPTISGFGIGLYLCDEIIQRHNGRIWAKSEAGVGSTFHFSLPIV